jgi:hypothetical protein
MQLSMDNISVRIHKSLLLIHPTEAKICDEATTIKETYHIKIPFDLILSLRSLYSFLDVKVTQCLSTLDFC